MSLTCRDCGRVLGREKLVIGGRLACPDCQYEAEYGPVERANPALQLPRTMPPAPLQEERLFPLAAWQKDVVNGNTQLGYDEWVKERRETARHKRGAGMRWGLVALALGAGVWLLSHVASLPEGLINILAGSTR